VVDINASVGGVWSNERRYSGLQTNNLLGTYEYSDFPMDPVKYGLKERKAVPGHIVQQYHHDYAVQFNVLPKIRFKTKVESAERQDGGGWLLNLSSTQKDGSVVQSQIFTAKLIVATGMASAPAQPVLKGMTDFGAPLFHFKNMSSYEEKVSGVKRVCVYGGTKQACDAVYMFGTKGVQVDWVIRESGHGPTWSTYSASPKLKYID
jgi:cation diffusion facilitator CzcD-associated flavoprotein CzcO